MLIAVLALMLASIVWKMIAYNDCRAAGMSRSFCFVAVTPKER